MLNKFPCTSCGCCCRRIGKTVEKAKFLSGELAFPFKWDETGKCEMLTDDNRCRVYDTRPLVCRIEEMYKYFGSYSREEFYKMNIAACNQMMDEDGVDKKYRIPV